MNNENYWKCEYENLRRKKKEEIEELKYRNAVFVHKTYDLLKALGLSDTELFYYYGGKNVQRD